VARVTIVGDRLLVGTRMRAVMAPEATVRIGMADIIQVCSPRHLHLRKDVPLVGAENRLGTAMHLIRLLRKYCGIVFLPQPRQFQD